MNTITTYEIYRAAWSNILGHWSKEAERQERGRKEGRPTPIADARLKKYRAQLDELEKEILKMERRMNAEQHGSETLKEAIQLYEDGYNYSAAFLADQLRKENYTEYEAFQAIKADILDTRCANLPF